MYEHPYAHAQVAHVFVSLANLVLLSRGKNILSEDFKYYSPGTGKLDRDRFVSRLGVPHDRHEAGQFRSGQVRYIIPEGPPWKRVLISLRTQYFSPFSLDRTSLRLPNATQRYVYLVRFYRCCMFFLPPPPLLLEPIFNIETPKVDLAVTILIGGSNGNGAIIGLERHACGQ